MDLWKLDQYWIGHHNNYSHKNLVNWKWFPALYTLHVENNLSKSTGKVTVNKLFTCYNYKARLHRCMLIDLLYKNNLQDLGYSFFHEGDIRPFDSLQGVIEELKPLQQCVNVVAIARKVWLHFLF